jgi:hypothetical protein
MIKRFRRYAIYWTPDPGSFLDAFGERWFGGETFGLPAELAARAIEAPAHYGLHATLKAPFRLAENRTETELRAALDRFCAVRREPCCGPLSLACFQRYLVLVVTGTSAEIDWLAAQCVTAFDSFRAPLGEEDRERRQRQSLSAGQAAFLEAFGYPYVLSEFRFHISLAGPLEADELMIVEGALSPPLDPALREGFRLQGLTLSGEPFDGSPFQIVSRHRFRR